MSSLIHVNCCKTMACLHVQATADGSDDETGSQRTDASTQPSMDADQDLEGAAAAEPAGWFTLSGSVYGFFLCPIRSPNPMSHQRPGPGGRRCRGVCRLFHASGLFLGFFLQIPSILTALVFEFGGFRALQGRCCSRACRRSHVSWFSTIKLC